jgi:sulfatase modifying factor 1
MKSSTVWTLSLGAVAIAGIIAAGALVPVGPGQSPREKRLKADAPHANPASMVWVRGGEFEMGSLEPSAKENPDRIRQDEFPRHPVELDGFWMDEAEVTNAQFAEFVEMTGYVTFAEKKPTRDDFARSGVDASLIPEDKLVPGSMVFKKEIDGEKLNRDMPHWEYQVWEVVNGADWRHPEGPDSSIQDRMNHPVVHMNWEDAAAYLTWAGKRLPTEAEYEYASRNGGQEQLYPWGNEREPAGSYMCNYWQGDFPLDRRNEDGHVVTAPVKSFKPNSIGLYDISGNVWEWCHDFYRADYYAESPKRNPQGPSDSHDPDEPGIIKRVHRGGSFLCNSNSCTGYRCSARMKGDFLSGTCHTGFRGVVDAAGYDAYVAAQKKIDMWRASRKKTAS